MHILVKACNQEFKSRHHPFHDRYRNRQWKKINYLTRQRLPFSHKCRNTFVKTGTTSLSRYSFTLAAFSAAAASSAIVAEPDAQKTSVKQTFPAYAIEGGYLPVQPTQKR